MQTYVTHLESAIDGTQLPADCVQTMHDGRPLWVRYDLERIARSVSSAEIATRSPTLWRYRECLPLPKNHNPVTLGEGMSPLLSAPRLAHHLGLDELLIKDESQLPTGSFKSRGLCLAVSMANRFGLKTLAIPTAGNAGGALAAYAARAGMTCHVFMPEDTPLINKLECVLAGARVHLVKGLINDCGALVRRGVERFGWFDCSTLKEPYRLEGKKTMGYELAEQLGWTLPDVILYPTGGGTGLIGMWKAFHELRELGWLTSENLPRMVAVQSSGCAPIIRAWEKGDRFAAPWDNAATCASGLRVPVAVGDFMILDAVRASQGCAIAAPETDILPAMNDAHVREGISICPEAAACLVALRSLISSGWIARDERVVLFNMGAATKYVECVPLDLPVISDPQTFDLDRLA